MAASNLKTFFGETIDMFWWPRESGTKGYRSVNSDKGNAFGVYQFDRRYALVPFMKSCVEYNGERYSGFKKFIKMGAGAEELLNNKELGELWVEYCDRDIDEFSKLQDDYAYNSYYIPAKKYAIKNGVPVDDYTPVLKGSLWSFAIRSGSANGAKKIVNAYKSGAKDELKLLKASYASYSNQDANRWSTSSDTSQYADAVRIYKEQYLKEEVNEEKKEESKPASVKYRVGTDWKDGKCVGQIGAYNVLEYAKDAANKNTKYKVFDENGKVVYQKKEEAKKEEIKKEEPKKEVSKPVTPTVKYRVGTDWKDGKCAGQIGAYNILEYAKEAANKDKKYKVFDENGKVIYQKKEDIKKPESKPEYPDSYVEYKVCTGWNKGHSVGQKGAYTIYANAKKDCEKFAKADNKVYYVYNTKGIRLYMYDPKAVKKDVPSGYKVGTSFVNGKVVNQKGAFTKYANATKFADTLSKTEKKSYKVYLDGKLQYTGTTK